MNFLTNLLGRFQPVPASAPTIVEPAGPAPLVRDPRVAFEVPSDEQTTVQVIYPCRTRHMRIEPEAQVYVLIYRDFGRAIRYVELHGSLRKDFGGKIPMWTEDCSNRRDDDLMAEAVVDAKAIMMALRNPVECPVVEAITDEPHPPASHVSARVEAGLISSPAPNQKPTYVREGRFFFAGVIPWRSDDGKTIGKDSFAVILRRQTGDKEERVYGSDLARVISEHNVQPGDFVRLAKYHKVAVPLENRVVYKNLWTCQVIERADRAVAATS